MIYFLYLMIGFGVSLKFNAIDPTTLAEDFKHIFFWPILLGNLAITYSDNRPR